MKEEKIITILDDGSCIVDRINSKAYEDEEGYERNRSVYKSIEDFVNDKNCLKVTSSRVYKCFIQSFEYKWLSKKEGYKSERLSLATLKDIKVQEKNSIGDFFEVYDKRKDGSSLSSHFALYKTDGGDEKYLEKDGNLSENKCYFESNNELMKSFNIWWKENVKPSLQERNKKVNRRN